MVVTPNGGSRLRSAGVPPRSSRLEYRRPDGAGAGTPVRRRIAPLRARPPGDTGLSRRRAHETRPYRPAGGHWLPSASPRTAPTLAGARPPVGEGRGDRIAPATADLMLRHNSRVPRPALFGASSVLVVSDPSCSQLIDALADIDRSHRTMAHTGSGVATGQQGQLAPPPTNLRSDNP